MRRKKKRQNDFDKVGTFEVMEQINIFTGDSRWVITEWVHRGHIGVMLQRRWEKGSFDTEEKAEYEANRLRVIAGWEGKT